MRWALSVFFVSGLLMSVLGAVLPAWGYHLKDNHSEAGRYFLAQGLGLVASYPAGTRLLRGRTVPYVTRLGAALAAAAFVWLALASPPQHWMWRAAGLFVLGWSAGLLNAAAFQSISRSYEYDRAQTVNLAGAAFGLGCTVTALLLWGVFYIYNVSSILLLLGLIPAFAGGFWARASFGAPASHPARSPRAVWNEVRSPGAVLFSLLLFFQFANEWCLAGWLPVYLVQRIGLSPDHALLLLSAYWLSLLVGRMFAQALLPRMGHGRMLAAATLAAELGCLILLATNNRFGAWAGTLLAGAGFSPIYPLVSEKIGHRFPDYHPGFFNGILSLGISGGLLAPWTIGYAAQQWGIWAVLVTPLAGSIMVSILLVLLHLEARLTAA